MAQLAFAPFLTAFDENGDPLSGAKAYWYLAGTTTPTNTYTTSALSVANANPVVADAYGRFGDMWLADSLTYKVVLKKSDGTTIRTVNEVYSVTSLDVLSGDRRYIGVPGGAAYDTTGSANAYVVTTGLSLSALPSFCTLLVRPNFTNTGAATINVDGLGAKNIYMFGSALQSGEMVSGQVCEVIYDGTQFQLLGAVAIAMRDGPPTEVSQHRLSLTTALAVTVSDVTAAATLYMTPDRGNSIALWDGTNWKRIAQAELSMAFSSNAAHTNYQQSGKNFDVWYFDDAGTKRIGTGAAWSSDTARADALTRLNGVYVNNATIAAMRFGSASGNTVSVAANKATWLGTIRMTADGQTEDSLAKRFVWNMYNRRPRAMKVLDGTDSWSYSTATYRQMNNSATNQLAFVRGLNEDAAKADVMAIAQSSAATLRAMRCGVGLDSTTATSGLSPITAIDNTKQITLTAKYSDFPGLGYHYLAALEYGGGGDTQTFYGDAGTTSAVQAGIVGEVFA